MIKTLIKKYREYEKELASYIASSPPTFPGFINWLEQQESNKQSK